MRGILSGAKICASAAALALVLAACGGDDGAAEGGEVTAGAGVDVEEQVLTIGALNDESGPAAAIGVPYAVGKRVLVEQANAGELDVMPEGWTVELVERDHGYNPSESVSAFAEISEEVLFLAHSFGTPNTLPLVPDLEEENIVAYPASLSSAMAENEHTPPIGSPYRVEAHQALDWAVEDAGGAENVRMGIVFQEDDYGQDGLEGLREAAEHHEVEIVSEAGVAPAETEFTAPVTELEGADANYVLLATLPSATGPILGTAASLGYTPTWLGNTPAWIDAFFDPETLPAQVYANFRWVTGLTLWGEDVPGMSGFLDAYEEFGADAHHPDFYILASYGQGVLGLEAFSRALENGDVTREGYLEALGSIDDFEGNGLFPEPVDLTTFPYVTATDTRVLAPGEDLTEWEVLRDYSTPPSWEG